MTFSIQIWPFTVRFWKMFDLSYRKIKCLWLFQLFYHGFLKVFDLFHRVLTFYLALLKKKMFDLFYNKIKCLWPFQFFLPWVSNKICDLLPQVFFKIFDLFYSEVKHAWRFQHFLPWIPNNFLPFLSAGRSSALTFSCTFIRILWPRPTYLLPFLLQCQVCLTK